ncbi:helix-turn-helix domain-containing protein [Kordiimonas pumila]|uniref:Helix-turn-helix domain-containing protein n=1 Tax=Kordiimonas pumila TaxID=2161677 RepID=A0ABV7D5A2_9PROT|nr:XRE family transcriptional regulator [Kordiimonas pumila]
MTENNRKGRMLTRPGATLKALRKKKGMTIADVSLKTGLPLSSISKLENDKIALTFDKLILVSEALDVDISELFAAPNDLMPRVDGATRRSITRASEGRAIETAQGNYLYLASELLYKKLAPIFGEVFQKDITKYGEFFSHPGEEFVYVLQGTLELHTEIYTPAKLEVGDSIYFDSSMRHAYIAVGDEPCRILSICTTTGSDGGNFFGNKTLQVDTAEAGKTKRRTKTSS